MTTRFLALALSVCGVAACAEDPGTGLEAGDPDTDTAATESAIQPSNCIVAPSGDARCFATFTEAIAVATNGAITDAPIDASLAVDDEVFTERLNAIAGRQRGAQARAGVITPFSTVIGIVYKDANYGGNDWVFYQPYGCDGNLSTVDFVVPNLNEKPYRDYGFNDNISSFHSYSGCQTVVYEDWWFLGAATNGGYPAVDMGYVGNAMNDRGTSIRWF